MTVEIDEPGFASPPATTIVTGASGWLGTALLHGLAGRDRVRALVPTVDEAASVETIPGVEAVVGDIRDPAVVDDLFTGTGPCTVFHAAAVIHPRKSTREFFDVNVGGTALVLDRARRAGARRVVHVSSNSPFGTNATAGDAFDECAPFDPYMGYGRSKMEAEQLVARAAAAGDVETVVVRPPWFYGPHQPARQTTFFTLVRRGMFPVCGRGENRRSLVYVDDLVDALVRAELREGVSGRAYWIADARPYSMNEILESVRRALHDAGVPVRPQRLRLPRFAASVALAGDRVLQATGRYSQQLHVLSEMDKTIACRIDRARDELKYEPSVGLDEGMRRSVAWCIERGITL